MTDASPSSASSAPPPAGAREAGAGDAPPALPAWWGWLVTLLVATIPLATGFSLTFLKKRPVHVTPFDPLLLLALAGGAGWILASARMRRRWREGVREALRATWPGLLLLLAGALSCLAIESGGAKAALLAGKELVQLALYLVLFPLVALPLLTRPAWRRRAMAALAAGTLVALATALRDRVRLEAGDLLPHFVGGTLGNRNTLGLYLALALPVLLAAFAGRRSPAPPPPPDAPARTDAPPRDDATAWGWTALWSLPLAAAGTHAALLAAGIFGATVAVVAASRRRAAVMLLALLLLLAASRNRGAAQWSALARSIQTHVPVRDTQTGMTVSRPTLRYIRWAANMNLLAAHPFLGVGAGQYQRAVKPFYGDIPRPEGRTDRPELYDLEANEPFSFGGFFLIGTQTGVVGLAALTLLLAELLGRALGGRGRRPCLYACGICGAVAGILISGWWTSFFVRGAGPVLGLLLALSAVPEPRGAAEEENTNKKKDPEGV